MLHFRCEVHILSVVRFKPEDLAVLVDVFVLSPEQNLVERPLKSRCHFVELKNGKCFISVVCLSLQSPNEDN